jgi:hypothetical protein
LRAFSAFSAGLPPNDAICRRVVFCGAEIWYTKKEFTEAAEQPRWDLHKFVRNYALAL